MGDVDEFTLYRIKSPVNMNEPNVTNSRASGLISTCIEATQKF